LNEDFDWLLVGKRKCERANEVKECEQSFGALNFNRWFKSLLQSFLDTSHIFIYTPSHLWNRLFLNLRFSFRHFRFITSYNNPNFITYYYYLHSQSNIIFFLSCKFFSTYPNFQIIYYKIKFYKIKLNLKVHFYLS